MKKKMLAILMCLALAAAMAVPAFADTPSAPKANNTSAPVAAGIQPRTNVGVQSFQLLGTSLYLNINNSSHPGKALANDPVIIWNYTTADDQKWDLWFGGDGGYYFRPSLNLTVAMNINHAQNQCTLFSPSGNYTNGKSDSDIYMNGSRLQLSAWGYQLTNSIPQSGYASYWTGSGSDYASR